MKTFGIIVKVVIALAAVAGIIYLAAAYGDRVVAWAKKLASRNKSVCVDYDENAADFDPNSVIATDNDFED